MLPNCFLQDAYHLILPPVLYERMPRKALLLCVLLEHRGAGAFVHLCFVSAQIVANHTSSSVLFLYNISWQYSTSIIIDASFFETLHNFPESKFTIYLTGFLLITTLIVFMLPYLETALRGTSLYL